jgi:hypothetical protein
MGMLEKWIKELVMSDNTLYRGLCSTCRHASACTFPADVQRPAFYCEEFEIEIAPVRKTSKGNASHSTVSPIAVPEESAELIGLCSDCESRHTCIFPKLEGGIWHCEEYK